MKKTSGTGLPMIVFLTFLILKLTGNLNWGWIWITSPIWIPIVLAISTVIVLAIIIIALMMSGKTLDDIREMIKKIESKLK